MAPEIEKILEIGERGHCTEEELLSFLPNYPTLRGSEFIFTIGWANASHYFRYNIRHFVHGLHFVELKYRELRSNEFGFGSPSPSYKVITALQQLKPKLADELEEWIRSNGGNYYVK